LGGATIRETVFTEVNIENIFQKPNPVRIQVRIDPPHPLV
jgi:hypothetical protein